MSHIGIFGKRSHAHVAKKRIPASRNSPSRRRKPESTKPRDTTNDQKKAITPFLQESEAEEGCCRTALWPFGSDTQAPQARIRFRKGMRKPPPSSELQRGRA